MFNQQDRLIEEQVPLGGFKAAKDLLGGDIPEAGGVLRITVDAMDVRCILLES